MARDWIEMGDELRTELDALHDEAAVLYVDLVGGFLVVDWGCEDAERRFLQMTPEQVTRAQQSARKNAEAPSQYRKRYAEIIAKLKAHDRCSTWPDNPRPARM